MQTMTRPYMFFIFNRQHAVILPADFRTRVSALVEIKCETCALPLTVVRAIIFMAHNDVLRMNVDGAELESVRPGIATRIEADAATQIAIQGFTALSDASCPYKQTTPAAWLWSLGVYTRNQGLTEPNSVRFCGDFVIGVSDMFFNVAHSPEIIRIS